MKQPGNGGRGQNHCIRRDSKSFFICRTASWSGSGKLESAIPATVPYPSVAFPGHFPLRYAAPARRLGQLGFTSIAEPLFESESLCRARGAFTGAVRGRAGKFEAAEGGTLFLDEVEELSCSSHGKQLRFLEDRIIERVGDNKPCIWTHGRWWPKTAFARICITCLGITTVTLWRKRKELGLVWSRQ